jgi:signal transduction histidine kinase/tetratricopeptide (TPR) repeat protein
MLSKLLLILLLISSVTNSQKTADSILFNLEVQLDSEKIPVLLKKAWELRSNDPLTALQLAKNALNLSVKSENKSLQAKSLNYLGIIYTNLGANEVALDHHNAALNISKDAEDWEQLGYSYNNIGGIYGFKNDISLAIENIQKAIKIFEDNKYQPGLAYCSINIGKLYENQDNFDKSLEYFNRALQIALGINKQDLHARILLEIANLQYSKGKLDKAKDAYLELEKYYKEINYLKGSAEIWNGLAEVYIKEKKFKDALTYSEKALNLNKQILNGEGEIVNINNMALINLALGKKISGENFLAEARSKANELKDPYAVMDMYNTHYNFYKKTGDLQKSIKYYEKYNQLQDSIFTNEEVIKLGELEALLRIEKAEREKQVLQKELEIQKNQRDYFIVILILLLLIAAIITYRFFEKKKLNEELKKTNLVKDKFFRIISHDLREPFSAILGSIEVFKDCYNDLNEKERIQTIETIQKAVEKDFELLENLLLWSRNQSNDIVFDPVKLSVKDIIEKNIFLIKSNLTKKEISVDVICESNLFIMADEQMLNSILRNLIFNAVKFTRSNGKITISVEKQNGFLNFLVKDNGLGMDQYTIDGLFQLDKKVVSKGTAGESGSGIGLILTKEFIERHKGEIAVESQLNVGSTFKVKFPNNSIL